jgi:ketopantoate hydroxymethyltransferase
MQESPKPPTAAQILRVAELIRAGHSDDAVVAAHVGITPEQVAHLRKQGLGVQIKRKPSARKTKG